MNQAPVSVIICTYTEERLKDLHEAVDSVLAQTVKPHEVIVSVDHNEPLFQRLRAELPPPVKVVFNDEARGSSGTRNCGIRAASGEYLVCADDDIVAEADWLERLTAPFADSRVLAVAGRAIAQWPRRNAPLWFPQEFDFILGCTEHKKLVMQGNNEVRNVTSCNAAFRRQVFDTVGYWESSLGRCDTWKRPLDPIGGEEAEFCLRLKSSMPSGAIVYQPDAVVHHKVTPQRATLRYVFNFCLREGVTRAMIRRIVSGYGHKPLAAEGRFLRFLLFRSYPARLKAFYKPASLAQAAVISANLSLMGTGYVLGRCTYR